MRSRSTGLSAADVDAALTTRRTLVVSWLNRGTLHLVRSQDYWWLHALTTPQLRTSNQRRLRQEGVSAEQTTTGVDVVVAALSAEGPLTREALRARLDAAGVPTAGQALVHLLLAATLAAQVVRGPVVDGQQAFVLAEQWLGPPASPLDADQALALLADRYLAGHRPADDRDLAQWAGISLGRARQALASGAAEEHSASGGSAVGSPAVGSPAVGGPAVEGSVRLLGPFDPLLHGWASRDPVVGPYRQLVTRNGIFRASVLVDGRAVGTWGLTQDVLTVRLYEAVPDAVRSALHEEAADVRRFLGLPASAAVVVLDP